VTHDRELERLEAEGRYSRQRYDLYRAKAYGPRPTSQRRMQELQRAAEAAETRLAAARAAARDTPR